MDRRKGQDISVFQARSCLIHYPDLMDPDPAYFITDPDEFSALYGPPLERSVRKQMDHIDDLSRAFIAASPLLVLATSDGVSFDASPRGDAPGFVHVADDHTLLIPDRRGNNRLDSLRNIVRNPCVGLLFLVPGVRETFRVNGKAMLSRDPALTAHFSVQDKLPNTVIIVSVKEAYIHCSRALVAPTSGTRPSAPCRARFRRLAR